MCIVTFQPSIIDVYYLQSRPILVHNTCNYYCFPIV